MPHLNELYEKYKDDGLVVLGICTSSRGQERMEQTVKQTGMKYPVARDPDTKTAEKYNVQWYPTYTVVGRNGRVRAAGIFHNTGMEEIIKTLLEEKPEASGGDAGGEAAETETAEAEIPREFFENPNASKLALLGKQAPELQVEQWINSDPLKLSELTGNVVLLDYWATW